MYLVQTIRKIVEEVIYKVMIGLVCLSNFNSRYAAHRSMLVPCATAK
jgi:hypothetical protein